MWLHTESVVKYVNTCGRNNVLNYNIVKVPFNYCFAQYYNVCFVVVIVLLLFFVVVFLLLFLLFFPFFLGGGGGGEIVIVFEPNLYIFFTQTHLLV